MPREMVFDLTALTESLKEIDLIGDAAPPTPGPEEDLKISIHDRIHNTIVSYIMSNNARMAILMSKHAEMAAYSLDDVNFLLGARKVMPQDTPHSICIKAAGGFLSVRPVERWPQN
ncbi:hypothetical protein CAC42_2000 [Sphaceloma murrayae]|uniref:Uncharacterized protein n=1 Tax=Sphaceloma murrayae TaxID=2082308 RepID=A0A2K1QII4_9PEZI|nr:hypothetical protein CAC42_2000 [Sphaceloma murrayae]